MYSLQKNNIHPHFIFFHHKTFCKFIYFSVSGLFMWLLYLCNQFQLNVGVNLEAEEMQITETFGNLYHNISYIKYL